MYSAASDRNKEPIFAVLRPQLAKASRLLELACGSLQHACYMAPALPELRWLPTDIDAAAISHGTDLAHRPPSVAAPVRLDVHDTPWSVTDVDAIYAANLLHISPRTTVEAVFQGARRVLRRHGRIFLYGPFMEAGRHTSPGNEAFDASLKARDARWGIRALEDVVDAAGRAGFELLERNAMPANNLLLVFAFSDRSDTAA